MHQRGTKPLDASSSAVLENKESFDIITGCQNVNSFDTTYLCNRIDRILGEDEHKKTSPWNQSDVREFTSQVIRNNKYTIYMVSMF